MKKTFIQILMSIVVTTILGVSLTAIAKVTPHPHISQTPTSNHHLQNDHAPNKKHASKSKHLKQNHHCSPKSKAIKKNTSIKHHNLKHKHNKKTKPQQLNRQLKAANKKYHSKIFKVLKAAFAQLGKPYQYASIGPDEFDCSGLTMYCYKKIGIDLPHNAYAQSNCGHRVAYRNLKPGDLVFFNYAEHVGIYVGNGKYIHAPHTGKLIEVDNLAVRHDYFKACRPVSN